MLFFFKYFYKNFYRMAQGILQDTVVRDEVKQMYNQSVLSQIPVSSSLNIQKNANVQQIAPIQPSRPRTPPMPPQITTMPQFNVNVPPPTIPSNGGQLGFPGFPNFSL